MLQNVRSVTDIGCGGMSLEKYIPNATYFPVDCVQRDARTVVVDLNHGPSPRLHTEAAVLLGVLEYIHNVPKLIGELALSYPQVLLSYNRAEDRVESDATSNTWVNCFSSIQLEELFASAGLEKVQRRGLGRQTLWLLRSTACNAVVEEPSVQLHRSVPGSLQRQDSALAVPGANSGFGDPVPRAGVQAPRFWCRLRYWVVKQWESKTT
jgi:hypothetical protein